MNYQTIYIDLITRAFDRPTDQFSERHHIIPICAGGDDSSENIVWLTPEEHYISHLLLCRVYPENEKLAYDQMVMAAGAMIINGTPSNKAYGWLKRRPAETRISEHELETMPVGRFHGNLGTHRTLATRAQMSLSHLGREFSEATRARMAAAAKSRAPMSEETRRRMSERRKGIPVNISPETRAKMAEAKRGVPLSPETRAKMAEAKRGTKLSPETRAKMAEAARNRKKSQ